MRHGARRQRRRTGEARVQRQVKHARARLGERYGLYLSEAGYWQVVAQVRRGEPEARLVYQQTGRRSWHLVRVQGRPAIAVYDAWLGRVATFLAPDALRLSGLRLEDVAAA